MFASSSGCLRLVFIDAIAIVWMSSDNSQRQRSIVLALIRRIAGRDGTGATDAITTIRMPRGGAFGEFERGGLRREAEAVAEPFAVDLDLWPPTFDLCRILSGTGLRPQSLDGFL
jgi:hypothetical protein